MPFCFRESESVFLHGQLDASGKEISQQTSFQPWKQSAVISANLTSPTLKVTSLPADPGEGQRAIFGLQLVPGRQAALAVY